MIEIIDVNDSRAVRNKDNVLALYDLMINKKKSEEAMAKFVSPAYIQHNPLIADGSVALGKFFGQVTREHAQARVVVHRIIAVGDYVWAHVNFLNLFNDDPGDTGIAGASTSISSTATARQSNIGTPCNSLATRKTRRRWLRRTFRALIRTECSEREEVTSMERLPEGSDAAIRVY
jgi:predicted SnoaL-like aldol condensation-catalyzing enzyme